MKTIALTLFVVLFFSSNIKAVDPGTTVVPEKTGPILADGSDGNGGYLTNRIDPSSAKAEISHRKKDGTVDPTPIIEEGDPRLNGDLLWVSSSSFWARPWVVGLGNGCTLFPSYFTGWSLTIGPISSLRAVGCPGFDGLQAATQNPPIPIQYRDFTGNVISKYLIMVYEVTTGGRNLVHVLVDDNPPQSPGSQPATTLALDISKNPPQVVTDPGAVLGAKSIGSSGSYATKTHAYFFGAPAGQDDGTVNLYQNDPNGTARVMGLNGVPIQGVTVMNSANNDGVMATATTVWAIYKQPDGTRRIIAYNEASGVETDVIASIMTNNPGLFPAGDISYQDVAPDGTQYYLVGSNVLEVSADFKTANVTSLTFSASLIFQSDGNVFVNGPSDGIFTGQTIVYAVVTDGPYFTAAQVVNTASGQTPPPIGGYCTVSGKNFASAASVGSGNTTILAGVQVLLNGVPVSLAYVSPSQIVFLATGIQPGNVSMQVVVNGVASSPVSVTFSAAPALFTDAAGMAIVQDAITGALVGGPNETPLISGKAYRAFANGLGQASLPVAVIIGTQSVSAITQFIPETNYYEVDFVAPNAGTTVHQTTIGISVSTTESPSAGIIIGPAPI